MKINDIVLENKANMSADDLEKAIRDAAKKYGINPDIAVRVWQSEGGAAYQSNLVPQKGSKTKTLNGKESSFGPFQLYTGGGLGNDYEKKYGVNLADDNTPEGLRRQIDFALSMVRKSGWTPWAGAKNIGVKKWQGVDFSDIQQSISNSGIKIDVDGAYGPKTKQAIKDFQKAQGLEVDGIIGPNTMSALKKFNSPEPKTTVDKPEKVDTPTPTTQKEPAGTTAAPATSIRPNARPTNEPDSGISRDTKDAIDAAVKKALQYNDDETQLDKGPEVMTTSPKLTTPKIPNGNSRSKGSTNKKTEGTTHTEITLEETQDFHEEFGYLGYSEDDSDLFEAEYQGRTVKLNKPMRGDVKKFKVYVKNDKGNVIKVNFGHGGTSAKSKGEKTMKIRKSNPKARASFRARHNCDNPGPKTKARYWSCRKW